MLTLCNEIWNHILSFLSYKDIYSLRFLCRRFQTIVLFSKNILHYRKLSHEILDTEKYYEFFADYLNEFLLELKTNFKFGTYLYLKHRISFVKNLFLCSNVLHHLFNCPRSNYIINSCNYCSRLLISLDFNRMHNLDNWLLLLVKSRFKSDVAYLFQQFFVTQFKLNIVFKTMQQQIALASDQKRCLTIYIIQQPYELVIKFLEVLFRVLSKFFYSIIETDLFCSSSEEREIFFSLSFKFIKRFLLAMTHLLNSSPFRTIFSDYIIDKYYDSTFLRLINKSYIKYCSDKYV